MTGFLAQNSIGERRNQLIRATSALGARTLFTVSAVGNDGEK